MFLYPEKYQRNKCAVSERMGYGIGVRITKQVKEKPVGQGNLPGGSSISSGLLRVLGM